MDLQLDGKVVLATRASQGIGRHVAEHLAAAGARVAIAARTAATRTAATPEAAAGDVQAATGQPVVALRKAVVDR